jgi:hypothetical protein
MKAYYPLIALICILYSCGVMGPVDYRYGSPLSKRKQMYMPKPMSSDTVKTANYVSAGVSKDNGIDQNFSDDLISGLLIYNRSQTFTNFSYSVGGYGFAGLYQNNVTTSGLSDSKTQVGSAYFKSNGFYSYGLQTSACFVTMLNKTELRLIGLELSYNNEFGDYLRYRKTASQQPYIYTDKFSENFNVGLSTELIFHAQQDLENQFGFRFYLGETLGNHNQTNYSNPLMQDYSGSEINGSFTFFLQVTRYFMTFEAANGNSATFRLGYRF